MFLVILKIPKIYLLSGISRRVYDPNEMLFDRAHRVKKTDIIIKNLISLLFVTEKSFGLYFLLKIKNIVIE